MDAAIANESIGHRGGMARLSRSGTRYWIWSPIVSGLLDGVVTAMPVPRLRPGQHGRPKRCCPRKCRPGSWSSLAVLCVVVLFLGLLLWRQRITEVGQVLELI